MVKPRKKAAVKKKASPRKGASPPFPAYPTWTTAKFYSFLRSALRQAFKRWPPKYEALAKASRKYEGPNPRQKKEFQCAICKAWHPQTKVEVDHIIPCGSLRTPEDIGQFVLRMFVSVESFRVLCKPCHLIITKEAREKKNEPSMDS